MCWSAQWSYTLATAGFTGAWWSRKKGHERFRWMPLVYFSGMELLQAITYSVINRCGLGANTVLTYISYVHIAFQPFFTSMMALSFLPQEVRKKAWWIWPVSGAATLVMLTMAIVPSWPGACNIATQNLCGPLACSYHGEWHIAWQLPLSNLDPRYLAYYGAVFFAPLLLGAWRWVAYHAVLGPILAFSLTHNKDERPAVWCLLSIAFLLATHVPAFERLLSAKKREEHAPAAGLAPLSGAFQPIEIAFQPIEEDSTEE